MTIPELTGWHIVAAVVALHALALSCAINADRMRSNLAWSALVVSAVLATVAAYLITYLYL